MVFVPTYRSLMQPGILRPTGVSGYQPSNPAVERVVLQKISLAMGDSYRAAHRRNFIGEPIRVICHDF